MTPAQSAWQAADTVLLDMDGTLLDLAFDSWFWREAVPRCMARSAGAAAAEVRDDLFARYARKQGSLEWYCLDYWTGQTGLDLRALKSAASHRIRYLPGARQFLEIAAGSGKRLVLVTNAHGHALLVKKGVAGLERYFEVCISAHEIGQPKELPGFWPELQQRLGFDPRRTLFVDDSVAVLDAAARFGIGAVLGVTRPDTRRPAMELNGHATVTGVAELLPAC
jgi:putative hydrolase of the HAD superfamily